MKSLASKVGILYRFPEIFYMFGLIIFEKWGFYLRKCKPGDEGCCPCRKVTFFLFPAVGFICLFLCSCSETAKKPPIQTYHSLQKLSVTAYPDFKDTHDRVGLIRALEQSLLYYNRVSSSAQFVFGEDAYDAAHMKQSLNYFLDFLNIDPSQEQIRSFLAKHYTVYTTMKKEPMEPEVLFTGYYEPSIPGSRTKDHIYRYPVYSRPDDLIIVRPGLFSSKYKGMPSLSGRVNHQNELIPYYTRAEINAKKGYENKASPVVWLKSRVDRFFLEIQGSGRVVLPDGGVMRVQYNAKNGQPYRAIGRYLIRKGEIPKEKMSMQAIRRWLEAHPDRMDEVLHYNPSVVFFREGKGGPYGCLGVAVTPMRSIATDISIFPKGALCFMETTLPVMDEGNGDDDEALNLDTPKRVNQGKVVNQGKRVDDEGVWPRQKAFSGFVLNQDTGGAIKGAGRADFFCGNGAYAEFVAGHMKQSGRLYFLVLKKL